MIKFQNLYHHSYLKASAGDIFEAFQAGNRLANKVRKTEIIITIKTSSKFIFDGNCDKK